MQAVNATSTQFYGVKGYAVFCLCYLVSEVISFLEAFRESCSAGVIRREG